MIEIGYHSLDLSSCQTFIITKDYGLSKKILVLISGLLSIHHKVHGDETKPCIKKYMAQPTEE